MLECPWILLALVFGYFLKFVWPSKRVFCWTDFVHGLQSFLKFIKLAIWRIKCHFLTPSLQPLSFLMHALKSPWILLFLAYTNHVKNSISCMIIFIHYICKCYTIFNIKSSGTSLFRNKKPPWTNGFGLWHVLVCINRQQYVTRPVLLPLVTIVSMYMWYLKQCYN